MDKCNSEGYPDPTAYAALMAIARQERGHGYLPLVYIACPVTDEAEQYACKARDCCRFAISKGCIPLIPQILYLQIADEYDEMQRSLAMRSALVLLGKCDEMWVFGEGMHREIAKARQRGMPIKYFNDSYNEVT